MSDDEHTPRLGLPYLAAAQAQKHVTLNEALGRLDGLVAACVQSRSVSAPPADPSDGDTYLAPSGGLPDAWTIAAPGDLLQWLDGVWSIGAAPVGLLALVMDEAQVCVRDAGGWRPLGERIGSAQALQLLGVGTTADAQAPLAAKLNAMLFTARTAAESGTGDLRATFNKEAAADVLSLLFQTGYGARAEVGLVGDDDLSVRTSPDGSAWLTALRIRRSDGAVTLPAQPLGLGEGGTGARSSAAACAAVGALALGGGVMTGPITTSPGIGLVCSTTGEVFPPHSLAVDESSHPTSNRAAMLMGANWVIGQDFNGTGARDLFVFNEALASAQLQLPPGGGVTVHGAPAFDASGVLSLKTATAAALPSPAPGGRLMWCTDAGAAVLSDGTAWRRLSGGSALVAADADRSVGALDAPVQVQTGALTATRHLTLPASAALGAGFRFVRSDAGAGALDVGGLKTLAAHSWCDVAFDGSAWRLVAAGAL